MQSPEKKNVKIVGEIVMDGKPLDFSFKRITSLQEVVTTEPRSGTRLEIPLEEPTEERKDISHSQISQTPKPQNPESEEAEEESPKKTQKAEPFKAPQPPAIQKVLAENLVSKLASNSIAGQGEDNLNTLVKKKRVRYDITSLVLSYNAIPDLSGFSEIMSRVMPNFSNLKWLDLSYNHLTSISTEIGLLSNLKTLYYHSNFVSDVKEVLNLQGTGITTLTLHGNSIDQLPNYRLYVITLLPQLRRLDTVLITKLERDNSVCFAPRCKKSRLPKVENPPMPKPIQVNEEEEESNDN